VGYRFPLQRPLVVEVELLQALAGREAGGTDASFTAVGFAGGDLALQAGGEELLMRPGLGPGPIRQAFDRCGQGRRLEGTGEERDLGCHVAAGLGGHHAATSTSGPNRRS
jgi:hypothetical protein